MKFLKYIILVIILVVFGSCELVQETKFTEDGSGLHSITLDLSEMGQLSGKELTEEMGDMAKDTIIYFSDVLEQKKDSISKLPKAEQERMEGLKDFYLQINSDPTKNNYKATLNYPFKNIDDLKSFSKKIEKSDPQNLGMLSTKELGQTENITDLNSFYDITFNKKKFSMKINQKNFEKIIEGRKLLDVQKDSSNDEMAGLIRYKVRYTFPYKIKKVNNEMVRITPDFRGIEFSSTLLELVRNPEKLEIEVEFQ